MTNPLSKIDKTKWIVDGSNGSNVSVQAADSLGMANISITGGERGTPCNARLNDPTNILSPSDSLYFEITLCDEKSENISIGFVTKEEFLPGWKTKGMFYNGNVTNGSAGLVIGFGPYPKANDTVGAYLQRSESTCKVIFYVNGRCLGSAFDLKAAPDTTLYPCLHLNGKMNVKFTVPQLLPTVVDREPVRYDDSYSGDWLLNQAFTGPELGELSLPSDVVISMETGDKKTYKLNVKVANSIFASFVIYGKIENFDKIKNIGPVCSTRMMPPDELMSVESFISSALDGGLSKMIVTDDGRTLIMSGPIAEMTSVRYEKEFPPVESYI